MATRATDDAAIGAGALCLGTAVACDIDGGAILVSTLAGICAVSTGLAAGGEGAVGTAAEGCGKVGAVG